MNDPKTKAWSDVVDVLRGVAEDLRTATGRAETASENEQAAAEKLKSDISNLERTAADLRSKLIDSHDAHRAEFTTAFDKERAERFAGQLKNSLDELVGLAKVVTLQLKTQADSSLSVAEPEIRAAVRALEDVAGSAGGWVRAVIDPDRPLPDQRSAESRPL